MSWNWVGHQVRGWMGRGTGDGHLLSPAQIKEAAVAMRQLPDRRLAAQIVELRQRTASVERTFLAFAATYEAARRVLSVELYDVQLEAGLALSRGEIAQMQTGEGKTFTALAPAVTLALCGRGVHVMTVNPYLAKRDFQLLQPVYQFLGLDAALLTRELSPEQKQLAYRADVTFGDGCEFGFDFLRDQSAKLASRQRPLGDNFRRQLQGVHDYHLRLQRGHAAAIIDEADSVMIDEAATPLVLAGSRPHAVDPMAYQFAWQIAQRLDQGKDFQLLPQKQEFEWTPGGKALVEATARELAINQLQRPWTSYVEQALRAQHLFLRDVHYVVADDKILLVDQHTGRIVPDRSWQDGLHQAVQVKEGVTLTPETFSIARITRQRYFSLYDHLCGMTGTTQGNEKELQNVYGLTVRIIATHRPCQRKRLPLRVFGSVEAKDEAIAADVLDRQKIGQPVLVGTPTIEASLRLSETLDKHGISHTVLNGDQDADEAQLISQAGLRGAVMIATNMAGRGTDIALGPGVAELGGLHVIVSEPQDSARSTRQLMGRAARQGDPGSCQCFASADDGALLKYAPAIAAWCYEKAGAGELAEPSRVERELEKIQRRAEHHRARQREALFQQDQWLQQAKKDLG